MENSNQISWDELIQIMENTSNLEGNIVEEDLHVEECMTNKYSYKRTFKEMNLNEESNNNSNFIKNKIFKFN